MPGQFLTLALDLCLLLRHLGIALLHPVSDQGASASPQSAADRRASSRSANCGANHSAGRPTQQRSDSGALLTRGEGL